MIAKPYRLWITNESSKGLVIHDTYSSYKRAVEVGQQVGGPANFHVECTDGSVPTREQQLGISTKESILDEI